MAFVAPTRMRHGYCCGIDGAVRQLVQTRRRNWGANRYLLNCDDDDHSWPVAAYWGLVPQPCRSFPRQSKGTVVVVCEATFDIVKGYYCRHGRTPWESVAALRAVAVVDKASHSSWATLAVHDRDCCSSCDFGPLPFAFAPAWRDPCLSSSFGSGTIYPCCVLEMVAAVGHP